MGEIVTFYSYKGGTGRTMALANVAWILASAGHRVLMVDWDLEAPGLHRYFHPFLKDRELLTSTGVIDVVIEFAVQATTPASTSEERAKTWYLPLADVLRHAMSIEWDFGKGQLDMLPAGQQSAAYATRVNSFNWDNFYERLGGGTFLEALRESMLRNYDYVLIDSRTGVSDTSGICTVQLPDSVVACFTLNRQSIEGAAATARSIVDARAKTQRGPVRILPVPTRVEKAETLKLEAARAASRQRFTPFLTHLAGEPAARYWDEIEIPYQPYYAYEEVLATFRDPSSSVGTVLYSMERLAARLIRRKTIDWTQPADDRRSAVLGGYSWIPEQPPAGATPIVASVPLQVAAPKAPERVLPVRQSPVGSIPARRHWFYVSYARNDGDRYVEQFVRDLDREVAVRTGTPESSGFFDLGEIRGGDDWERALVDGATRSRTAVCLVSQSYLYSEYCGREFALFKRLHIPILPVPWVPVQTELPSALDSIQLVDPAVSPRVKSSGVRALLRIGRYRNDYDLYLELLARHLTRLGEWSPAAAPREMPRFDDLPNAFKSDGDVKAGATVLVGCLASGQLEWRPYGSRSIGVLAQRAAAEEHFLVSTFDASKSLLPQLQGASDAGQLWIVLVDPAVSADDHVSRILADLTALRSSGRVIVVERASSEDELVATIRRELLLLRSEMFRQVALAPAATPVTLPSIR